MYGVTTTAAPTTEPVTLAAFKRRLRINHAAEDEDLAEMLAAAVEQFELDAHRPVLGTSYRQDLGRWPCGGIVLGRGGVTAVTAVKTYAADGSTSTLDADQWRANLLTPPARVHLAAVPDPVTTAGGICVTPVGCVEFTAGWASADAVPRIVRTAVLLLAGHYYANREAYLTGTLSELPKGWRDVVNKYKLGIEGDWGM